MDDQQDLHAENRSLLQRNTDRLMTLNQDIGSIKATIQGHDQRMTGLEQLIRDRLKSVDDGQTEINRKLDEILEERARLNGGWRALTKVGSWIVLAAAGTGWLIDHWSSILAKFFQP